METPTASSFNSPVYSMQMLGGGWGGKCGSTRGTFPEQINSVPGTYYPASEFVIPIPVSKENPRHFVFTYLGAMSLAS